MNNQNLLKTALIGALTLGAASIATASPAGAGASPMKGDMGMVKCYGINAAYKNDCKSPGHSCAGQDSKARDPNGFVAVPAGLCEKIDGGSTSPATKG
ncbi:MAG: DUF2282 domain-containing protein [Xanthomonadaceae bacterium]|nr:DUF2282 domain-containing protein [Xanthomonadaceae bacterium]MDE2278156.1 DUF2282 domain-containing protein [Xanthomonadaceae bacterium]MDE2316532.1 DUF2282 domain-containing protein [Xanthomonadaceae bacterium]